MKKLLLLLAFWGVVSTTQAQIVNIPDANFKAALINDYLINTNGDLEIQVSEATAYTGEINCSSLNIFNLTGIEAFTQVTGLYCNNNHLTSLDVTENTALQYLFCDHNQLTSLVSANTALTYLDCSFNLLSSLDVAANTALLYLFCQNNQLTSLNVTANEALLYLHCQNNQLSLVNVTANTALIVLICYHNQLTSLNVATNTALQNLSCYYNQLASLNVTTNTTLTRLYCDHNQLTSLDVIANTALTSLGCDNNLLSSLDVAANTALTSLDCNNNLLSSLDVSTNTALQYLFCNHNQLTSLNVTTNTALINLYCHDNQLATLNVQNGNNTHVTIFNATNNPNLTCIEVDNAEWSTENWTNIDAGAIFSENCQSGFNQPSAETAFRIFPNPSDGNFTISCGSMKNSQLIVTNILGEIIYSANMNTDNAEINFTSVPKGIYLFQLLSNSNVLRTGKIIID
ncbi:MAG TPA: T9SS type A sorting domain-containing protein [Bacteroidales bacterium]|nr:T9SS type A sorting domain-containing protein [Bacteroidales bacterium]